MNVQQAVHTAANALHTPCVLTFTMSQQLCQLINDIQILIESKESINNTVWPHLQQLITEWNKHMQQDSIYDDNELQYLTQLITIVNTHCTDKPQYNTIIQCIIQLMNQLIHAELLQQPNNNDNDSRSLATELITLFISCITHTSTNQSNIKHIIQLILHLLSDKSYTIYPSPPTLQSIGNIVGTVAQYDTNESVQQLYVSYTSLLCLLCRHNIAIRSHTKQSIYIKQLYTVLIRQLSHSNVYNVLYSLSLLAVLAINDTVETKLFRPANINSTLQLVFNIILNGSMNTNESVNNMATTNGSCKSAATINEDILQASVALLHDLLQSVHIMTSLQSYTQLQSTYQRVLVLCKTQFKLHIATPVNNSVVSSLLDLLTLLLTQSTLQLQLITLTIESNIISMVLTLCFDTNTINAVKSIRLLYYIQQNSDTQLNIYLSTGSPLNTLMSLLQLQHINAAIESDTTSTIQHSNSYTSTQVISYTCSIIQQLVRSDADVLDRARQHIDTLGIINVLSNLTINHHTTFIQLYISLLSLLVSVCNHISAVRTYCNVVFTDATISQLLIQSLHSSPNTTSANTIYHTLQLLSYATQLNNDTLHTLSENMCTSSKQIQNQQHKQQQSIHSIQSTNQQLQSQLQQCYDELNQYKSMTHVKYNQYQQQIDQLQSVIDNYDRVKQVEIDKVTTQHTSDLSLYKQKLHTSDAMLVESQQLYKQLQSESKQSSNQYNSLQLQYKELQQRNKLLESKSMELIHNATTVNNQVQQLQLSHQNELQQYIDKHSTTQQQLIQLKQQYDTIQHEQQVKIDSTYTTLTQLAQAYQLLESRYNTIQEQYQIQKQHELDQCNKLQHSIDTLQHQNNTLQQTSTILQSQCDEQQSSIISMKSDMEQLESNIIELHATNNTSQNKIIKLQQQLDHTQIQYNESLDELQRHTALATLIHSLSSSNIIKTTNVQQLTHQIALLHNQ